MLITYGHGKICIDKSRQSMAIMAITQGRRHGFLSVGGSNRRQGGQPTPKYPKNWKKTPDFGYFILESGGGGGDHPGFQNCGGQDPPTPPPSATPLLSRVNSQTVKQLVGHMGNNKMLNAAIHAQTHSQHACINKSENNIAARLRGTPHDTRMTSVRLPFWWWVGRLVPILCAGIPAIRAVRVCRRPAGAGFVTRRYGRRRAGGRPLPALGRQPMAGR